MKTKLDVADRVFSIRGLYIALVALVAGVLLASDFSHIDDVVYNVVMKRMNLTIFYPVSAGLIYIVVSLAGFLILKEAFTIQQLAGMAIILAGIVVMNIGKA